MTHPSILLLRWYLLLVNIYPSSPRQPWVLCRKTFCFPSLLHFFPDFCSSCPRAPLGEVSRLCPSHPAQPQGVLKNTQLGGQEGVASFFIRLLGREGNLSLQSCHLASSSPHLSPGRMMLRLGSNRMGWRWHWSQWSWKLLPPKQLWAQPGWIKGSGSHLLTHSLLLHFYEKIYPETTSCFVQKGSWDWGCWEVRGWCILQTNSSRYSRCLHPLLSVGWINHQLL